MFNKAISTPLAIGIILILAIIVGGVAYWQYSNTLNIPEISEIELSEKESLEPGETEDQKASSTELLEFITLQFPPPSPPFISSLDDAEDFKINFYYQNVYPGYMGTPDFFDIEESVLSLSKTKEKEGKYVYGPEYYSIFTEEGSHMYQGTPIFLLKEDSKYSASYVGFKMSDRDLISELKIEFGIDYRGADSGHEPLARSCNEEAEFSTFNFIFNIKPVYACGPGIYLRRVGESNLIFVEESDGIAWYRFENPIALYDLSLSYCDDPPYPKPDYCQNRWDDPEECWEFCYYNASIENFENGNLKMHIFYRPNDKEGFLGLQVVNLILTDSTGAYYQPIMGENFDHHYRAYLK